EELAARFGLDARRVRDFLRQEYPREENQSGADWYLTADQAERVVERFGPDVDAEAEEAIYSHWWTLLEQLRLRLLAAGTELRDMLDAQGIVWWLTNGTAPEDWSAEDKSAFAAYAGRGSSRPAPGDKAPIDGTTAPDTGLPSVTEELARTLHLPREWLQRMMGLLQEKRQLILYGPPGTGKTYIAQHIGRHVATAGGTFRLVQFHPSYTYEDFCLGNTPRSPQIAYFQPPWVTARP
ncbi:MAG: AAA family ATPase, partial [Solirubrobacteraceae bacterium]